MAAIVISWLQILQVLGESFGQLAESVNAKQNYGNGKSDDKLRWKIGVYCV